MTTRNESLDALRGFAILAMVLSGTIAYGDVLPAWMYHAQVPPPGHEFNPAIPGITWVDLVFPFFLFSMGAAIPLSLQKHITAGRGHWPIIRIACKRFVLLAFFALFTEHGKAWVMADNPGAKEHLLSLLVFGLLFVQFYENRNAANRTRAGMIRVTAFVIALCLLWWLPFHSGRGFDCYKSDVIIMVLANMALFGTLVYYCTAGKPLWRIALLPLIMAVFLAAKEPADGWAKALYNFSHTGVFRFDWLYKFYFLKYLFIIIPGTIAGEWMMAAVNRENHPSAPGRRMENRLGIMAFLLIITNLCGLFTRMLFANLIVSALVCAYMLYTAEKTGKDSLLKKSVQAGTYLLLLGLFFEAYEGGIRKDSSTYSYYFVTSGLAFFSLVVFTVMAGRKYGAAPVRYLSLNGKNPMVAYVTGNLLLLPLMELTRIRPFWDAMTQNVWMGFLKGLVFTAAVSLITIGFTRKKWFWKS